VPHVGFYVLLLGNAFLSVVFLGTSLGRFLFVYDANNACNLGPNALVNGNLSFAAGDHLLRGRLKNMRVQHRVQNPTCRRKKLVIAIFLRILLAIGDLKDRLQEIGDCLIRSEDAEVALVLIQRGYIAEERAEDERILDLHRSRHFSIATSGLLWVGRNS